MNTMPKSKPLKTAAEAETAPRVSKLGQLTFLLRDPSGVSMPAMIAATGWQAHSVRGALAGALKRKGHKVLSEKVEGERRWRIVEGGGQ
ncbi:DUF3489 domain-containing protein [Brevundimonas sp.]|uniref:DUF3489 domain-containing protein n=1 Tax=Brevundimonas sp. TaxID=1871086 RepID=UPI0028B10038|nr:DUF3489 domain-containing protein [Brevundimonas sp.]